MIHRSTAFGCASIVVLLFLVVTCQTPTALPATVPAPTATNASALVQGIPTPALAQAVSTSTRSPGGQLTLTAPSTSGGSPPATATRSSDVQAQPSATPPTPEALERPVTLPTPGSRDLIDLQRRLKPSAGLSITATPSTSPDYPVGVEQAFWIANQQSKDYFQATFRIADKTDHVYWYLQDATDLPAADLQTAASFFETVTYPTEHRYFGSELNPGIDNDLHLTVLIGKIPGVRGYFSSADEAPRSVNPFSNEREMIYINVDSVRPGTAGFNSTVAHEFMHMIQFNVHRDQDSWVNEGSAELAAQAVTGATSGTVHSFEMRPDTQLTSWAPSASQAAPHYGAAYLFMRYLAERFGGFGAVGRAVASPGRSLTAIDNFLAIAAPGRSADDLFADWVAANELSDPSLADGRYGYTSLTLHPTVLAGPDFGQPVNGVATQYGTTYFRLGITAASRLTFNGAPTTRLIGGDPKGASFEWWSNDGDSIDTRLTRSVDLRSVKTATLHFWTWYDIEGGYDYAYVEASVNGGKTWVTLPTRDTTVDNPNGQNYGNGFTGTSGGSTATWLPESVDLSPFGGQPLLIRFEYITDDSYNADGFAIDGAEIPEIGFHDDSSADNGWVAEGFARIDNQVPQSYLVEALSSTGPVNVVPMKVGADGKGALDLPGGQIVTIAVAGLTRSTTHGAPYTLTVSAR